LPAAEASWFNAVEDPAMNRFFHGFYFYFPHLLAEGNG